MPIGHATYVFCVNDRVNVIACEFTSRPAFQGLVLEVHEFHLVCIDREEQRWIVTEGDAVLMEVDRA